MKKIFLSLTAALILSGCGDQNQDASETKTITRQPLPVATFVGSYEKVDVHEEGVIKAAEFAVQEINKKYPNTSYSLDKIMSAQRQIVAGINYKLSLRLVENNRYPAFLKVIVFSQPWTNTMEVTHSVLALP